MAELGGIQSVITKAYREYDSFIRFNPELPAQMPTSMEESIDAIDNLQENLEKLFAIMFKKHIGIHKMEEMRPQLQKMMREAQKILDNTIDIKKEAYRLIK